MLTNQLCDAQVFTPSMPRGYSLQSFRNDLKALMLKAGLEGQPVCLFLEDRQLIDAGFLECVNSLLSGGEVRLPKLADMHMPHMMTKHTSRNDVQAVSTCLVCFSCLHIPGLLLPGPEISARLPARAHFNAWAYLAWLVERLVLPSCLWTAVQKILKSETAFLHNI